MRLCLITGSRAEYGVLEPLIQKIDETEDMELQLVATGAHLSPEFGMTADNIMYPYVPVEMLLSSDTHVGVAKSVGGGIISFADVLSYLRPDLVVLEGDRFEIFAVAATAYTLRIPIAHISGGDVTEGSQDDAYRDCITRMATLHFPDTEQAFKRVCQIRGRTNWVHCYGSLSADGVYATQKFEREAVLIAIHPSEDVLAMDLYNDLFRVIASEVYKRSCGDIQITEPCSDAGWATIKEGIDYFIRSEGPNGAASTLPNKGRREFLNALSGANFIIGNSSCGIVEAPIVGIPSINVGNRQQGRPRASSIIDCDPTKESIQAAIEKLNSPEFQESLKDITLAYTGGDVSGKILQTIRDWWEIKEGKVG